MDNTTTTTTTTTTSNTTTNDKNISTLKVKLLISEYDINFTYVKPYTLGLKSLINNDISKKLLKESCKIINSEIEDNESQKDINYNDTYEGYSEYMLDVPIDSIFNEDIISENELLELLGIGYDKLYYIVKGIDKYKENIHAYIHLEIGFYETNNTSDRKITDFECGFMYNDDINNNSSYYQLVNGFDMFSIIQQKELF